MAMQCGKRRLLKIISEAVTVRQMFVATVSNSHHILQMSVLWLDHSISLHHHLHLKYPSWSQYGTCQPALLIQASIKVCPVLCSTHTHPGEQRPPGRTVKLGWLQGRSRAQGSLRSRANGVFQTASHWAPKKGQSIAGSFIQERGPRSSDHVRSDSRRGKKAKPSG